MCIIFLHTDPKCISSNYKLVIAANRDEYYARPTKQAEFLDENSEVLCGIDLEAGAKYGTWFGVTKSGKFGVLTNYLTSMQEKEIKKSGFSRGSVVKDYLLSDASIKDYIQSSLIFKTFRPFNFIGGQLCCNGDEVDVMYFSNKDNSSPYKLENGSHVLACTKLGVPWNKAERGSQIFKTLLKKSLGHDPASFAELLTDRLLSDDTNLYPDQLVLDQAGGSHTENFFNSYCSILVNGLKNYGTRMQTVVLVDRMNHVYFTEKTLMHDNANRSSKVCSYDFSLTLK